ncbi:MAG: DUF2079 domain-containing protein [Verrucomicrobiia bacterium]
MDGTVLQSEPNQTGRSSGFPLNISEWHARWILATLIAACGLGLSYLAYLKYARFGWYSADTALYGYAFNQALHGKFFPEFVRGGSLLGNHPNFILLLWFPVFWACPRIYSLLLFQSLMISIAAWPMYLLAREKTGNRLTALIAAAGFLVFPPIVSQHVCQIHDDQFGLVFLLFAFYFFETGSFKWHSLFLVLSLLAKETIALTTAGFALYALVRRRPGKWVLFPAIASIAYVVLALKVLMPLWSVEVNRLYSHVAYFSDYGSSPLEVMKFVFSHPLRVVGIVLGLDRIEYLAALLLPLILVLPFRNWAWVLAAPSLAVNLFSSNELLRSLLWHYSLIPGACLWASFICALPGWSRDLAGWFRAGDFTRPLCVVALLVSLLESPHWIVPEQYQKDAYLQARREAVQAIPESATVLCPENMLAHFVGHPALNSLFELSYYGCDMNRVFDYEYVVLDFHFFSAETDWAYQAELFKRISKGEGYHLVFSRDKVFVFRKVGVPPRSLN